LKPSCLTDCRLFSPAILHWFPASSGRLYDAEKPALQLLLVFDRLEMPRELLSVTRLQPPMLLPKQLRSAKRWRTATSLSAFVR
jgi:hypothetical protein